MPRPRGREGSDEVDAEYDPSVFSRGLDVLVPAPLARWAVTVDVETDRDVYERDDAVELTITVANRLPVPINVPIADRRVWGWSVDGFVDGTDETIYVPDDGRTLSLRAGERRTFERTWDGRIKRDGSPTRWTELPRGEHEITAFVSTEPPTTDATTIEFR